MLRILTNSSIGATSNNRNPEMRADVSKLENMLAIIGMRGCAPALDEVYST
jgi:hypothetical protein